MNESRRGILNNWNATSGEIREVIGEAIHRALIEHQKAGIPAAAMRHGRVVLIEAEELSIAIHQRGESKSSTNGPS